MNQQKKKNNNNKRLANNENNRQKYLTVGEKNCNVANFIFFGEMKMSSALLSS